MASLPAPGRPRAAPAVDPLAHRRRRAVAGLTRPAAGRRADVLAGRSPPLDARAHPGRALPGAEAARHHRAGPAGAPVDPARERHAGRQDPRHPRARHHRRRGRPQGPGARHARDRHAPQRRPRGSRRPRIRERRHRSGAGRIGLRPPAAPFDGGDARHHERQDAGADEALGPCAQLRTRRSGRGRRSRRGGGGQAHRGCRARRLHARAAADGLAPVDDPGHRDLPPRRRPAPAARRAGGRSVGRKPRALLARRAAAPRGRPRPRVLRDRGRGARSMTHGFALRLTEDRLAGGGWLALPPLTRVLYLLAGDVAVTHGGQAVQVSGGHAWHGAGQSSVTTYGRGATVLRYELLQSTEEKAPEWPGVSSRVVLEHALALDVGKPYLMRCDRVDFAPGGEALPHGHKGGGIRYLIAGELEVRVGGAAGRVMKPGDAWFESGVEPVHAIASKTDPTAFIRVSILPREIRGQSSIVYLDPASAAVKPRQYTVFVDEPIELG